MYCDECGSPVENGKCTKCGKRFVVQEPGSNINYVPQGGVSTPKRQKFYQTGWFCILMLFFFFPVGLFLMWKYKKFNKVVRIVITVILALALIGNMGASKSDMPSEKPEEGIAVANTEAEAEGSVEANTEEIIETTEAAIETVPTETEEELPREYRSALKKARSYGEMMHMSKAAIFDQLVSEYGEQFSEEAAQYAMDNLVMDWNANALAKAESYSETMHMSKASIYDQLISEYGEKFTADEAQYAIDNIQADWNENALQKAISYQETMDMSPNAIYDQLVSPYGEKFTPEEARYAIDHLEK